MDRLSRLIALLTVIIAFICPSARACDPSTTPADRQGGCLFKSGEHRTDVDPDSLQVMIGPTGVAGAGIFLYEMIQFDDGCEDHLVNAMDWVAGEAIEATGNISWPGERRKYEVREDDYWFLHYNAAFIASILADAHTVRDDRNYLEVATAALNWVASEAIEFFEDVHLFVDSEAAVRINQSLAEGLAGTGHHALQVMRAVPDTDAAALGYILSRAAANSLHELGVYDPVSGGTGWTVAVSWSGPTGEIVANWCDGTAGVVDFYLEMYAHYGDAAYRDDAEAGLAYLLTHIPPLMDSGSLNTSWGKGASGIAREFVRAYHVLGDPTYLSFAESMGDYILADADSTQHGIRFWDNNRFCQQGNLGHLHFLDDLAAVSANPTYQEALDGLVDHLYATQVLSQYGTILPIFEDGNCTNIGQGWGQASLLLTRWGEPDVLGTNPKFIELCENFRDFLVATHVEDDNGWKWPMEICYTVLDSLPSALDDDPAEPARMTVLPNPGNPRAGGGIQFTVVPSGREHISLHVYDLNGRLVTAIADDELLIEPRDYQWNGLDAHGREVEPGVYFYEVSGEATNLRRKFVVVH